MYIGENHGTVLECRTKVTKLDRRDTFFIMLYKNTTNVETVIPIWRTLEIGIYQIRVIVQKCPNNVIFPFEYALNVSFQVVTIDTFAFIKEYD